jgi:hypothetical protein
MRKPWLLLAALAALAGALALTVAPRLAWAAMALVALSLGAEAALAGAERYVYTLDEEDEP